MALKLLLNTRLKLNAILNVQKLNKVMFCSGEIPKNALGNSISADRQQENGIIYDKKPIKLTLEAGKKYSWCLCGRSKNQPFCDGTHKSQQLKIKLKPIRFLVEESKDYWLCNCKQTGNRPFCDGTHKSKFVQEGTSTIRS